MPKDQSDQGPKCQGPKWLHTYRRLCHRHVTLILCNGLLLSMIFAWNDCYFCKLFVNPTSISNLTISLEGLQWYIVRTEILSTFHARVEYISVKKYAVQTSGNEKCPKPPLPLGARRPPFNTPIPRPTLLTTRNGIRNQSLVLPQYTFRTIQQTDQQMG